MTHDAVYSHCLAALIDSETHFHHRITGFSIAAGDGNVAVDCTATGIQAGGIDASGYHWPEKSHGVWGFSNCVAHNNGVDGIFGWQNDNMAHVIQSFVAYHNGRYGIGLGAYLHSYLIRDALLFRNDGGGIGLEAQSRGLRPLTIENCVIQGPYPVKTLKHRQPPSRFMIWRNDTFIPENGTKAIWVRAAEPSWMEFHDCDLDPSDFDIEPAVPSSTTIRLVENGSVVATLHG